MKIGILTTVVSCTNDTHAISQTSYHI